VTRKAGRDENSCIFNFTQWLVHKILATKDTAPLLPLGDASIFMQMPLVEIKPRSMRVGLFESDAKATLFIASSRDAQTCLSISTIFIHSCVLYHFSSACEAGGIMYILVLGK